ncbi:AbfB domain-containing protein [Streptomyces sp. NPDC007991]|uniref:AbfB domain-containing protein n=1 Tax=Streptomyces sp. NPDC007991 TaxID=3364803 RepID=UPI0036E885F6
MTWGLADGSCYSFRDSSGRYLRHKDLRIRADASNGTTLFNKDATFRADSSFRAVSPWA